jgi:hypothetical protein
MGMTDLEKTDKTCRRSLFTAFGCFIKTDAACRLSACHSRENGNPCLLKNYFYIVFLKEIMSETILI